MHGAIEPRGVDPDLGLEADPSVSKGQADAAWLGQLQVTPAQAGQGPYRDFPAGSLAGRHGRSA